MSNTLRTSRSSDRVFCVVALVVLAAGVSTNALAQGAAVQQVQTLQGTVQDARGVPLLGAFIAVIALGSDQPSAVVVTDARGDFQVRNLRAGMYSLLVGSLGFTGTLLQGINVPTAAPISLQLEPSNGRTLSAFDVPLDLSWALRSSKRDVLRQSDATLVSDAGDVVSDRADLWTPSVAAAGDVAPVVGEFRLWSVTTAGDHQSVGVTSLALGSKNSWNLTAHVGDRGSIWASSGFNWSFGSAHSVRVGFGYVGGSFDLLEQVGVDAEVHDNWIGRFEMRDTWQVSRPLSVSYGVRYEHHNYLAENALLSPSIEIAFTPLADTRLFTGVAYTSEGLDLAREDAGFEILSLLGQTNLRLADTSEVNPQRTLRYHLGLEQRIGQAHVSVKAYYYDMADELLGVYVSDQSGSKSYLLLNVGDANARGFELGVAGELMDAVSGQITYAFRDRDTEYELPSPDLVAVMGADFGGWSVQQTHELQASVSAELAPSHTRVVASYNWRRGMPVVRDGEVTDEYGRLDVQVRQLLPFRGLQTEWSAMLQVRNLLGPNEYNGLFNVSLAELMGLTRGIAGGLAVRF